MKKIKEIFKRGKEIKQEAENLEESVLKDEILSDVNELFLMTEFVVVGGYCFSFEDLWKQRAILEQKLRIAKKETAYEKICNDLEGRLK